MHLLRAPSFILGALSLGLLYAGFVVWLSASPFLLIQDDGYTTDIYVWFQLPIFCAYISGALLLKPPLLRIKQTLPILVGFTIAALAAFAMVIATQFAPTSIWALVIPMTAYGLGLGTTSATLHRVTLTATTERKGAAMAVFYLLISGAGLIGAIEVAAVHDTVGVVSGTIFAATILGFLCHQIALRLKSSV